MNTPAVTSADLIADTGQSLDTIRLLRSCHPNTRLTGPRVNTSFRTGDLVRKYDALESDRDHWQAEAEKWKAIALKLAG